jgi:hypothetical protein
LITPRYYWPAGALVVPHDAKLCQDSCMKEQVISRFGVISDTHGLLRREAVEALRGCMHIIHGGDIGASEILETLSGIAPVTAIRGNNDTALGRPPQ